MSVKSSIKLVLQHLVYFSSMSSIPLQSKEAVVAVVMQVIHYFIFINFWTITIMNICVNSGGAGDRVIN